MAMELEFNIEELAKHDKRWPVLSDETAFKLNNILRDVAIDIQDEDALIAYALRKAQVWNFLGKTVKVTIDRPIGATPPKHSDIIYPINYGFIDGKIAPDGEGLDVYILGVNEVLSIFTGEVIAIIHRENDVEDKLVAAPLGSTYSQAEVIEATNFQEQFYNINVECLFGDPIGDYIAAQDKKIQTRLREVYATIKAVLPTAEEKISYRMPTFRGKRNLIHFTAFKNHIGVYPGAEAIEHFTDRLVRYKTSKGTIQFPHDLPLPLDLIAEIVTWCDAADISRNSIWEIK